MDELVQEALPYFGVVFVPAFLLCLAPLLATRGRVVIGLLFLLVPVGFGIDLLLSDHSQPRTLQVPNVFPRGPHAEAVGGPVAPASLHTWIVAQETAPASHWHLFLAALFAIPGLLLLLRRDRERSIPNPIVHLTLVFLFFVVARLGLEKTAAPAAIVWAVGATPTLLVTLPFFGLYCGRRGCTFGKFCRQLVLAALSQRLPLIVFAYYATTHSLGTHLDTHVVTDIDLPLFGERKLENAFDTWLWPTLIPQLTVWIVVTVVAGIALGLLPRWWSSRKVVVVAGA